MVLHPDASMTSPRNRVMVSLIREGRGGGDRSGRTKMSSSLTKDITEAGVRGQRFKGVT